MAVNKQWNHIWIESDSVAAVKAFESMKLPWWMKRRWTNCRQKLLTCLLTSTRREVNFAADRRQRKQLPRVTS
ncbi:hypothetical protein FRX31_033712 [Thalictrum thalictroides]|uniref:RNase H type-1 domain-containing protein n=1 Tax=Thalictrum thalictroides TaxID=46969 RepID=A0A7J6UWY6_THATH|nr:hypothetical protein FRX31_033712 [Thalictrum thalictroides]